MMMFYLGQTVLLADQDRPVLYGGHKEDKYFVLDEGKLVEYEPFELDYLYVDEEKSHSGKEIYHGPFAIKRLLPDGILNKNFIEGKKKEIQAHIEEITQILKENAEHEKANS